MINKKIIVFSILALLLVGLVIAKTLTDTQFNKEKDSFKIKEKTGTTDTQECYNVYGDSTTIITTFRDGNWYREEVPVNHHLGNMCVDKDINQKKLDDALTAFKEKHKASRAEDLAKMETGRIG